MRLDHLLSKEREEVKVVLLLSNQCCYAHETSRSYEVTSKRFCEAKTDFFGDDALMGHTRSHSEHDG